jgi:hypothetical protein
VPKRSPKRDPWYAIRKRIGAQGIVYQVRLRRAGETFVRSFSAEEHRGARAALTTARAWRDRIIRDHAPETKRAFSERHFPHNTSGAPGVYLRRHVAHRKGTQYEYAYWQAQSPAGARPSRSRSFSIDRYGYDEAYLLAVEARQELLALAQGYVGIAPIPKRFRPAD